VEQYGKFDRLQWFLFVAEHSPTPQRCFAAAEKNCRFLGGIASAKKFMNLCLIPNLGVLKFSPHRM